MRKAYTLLLPNGPHLVSVLALALCAAAFWATERRGRLVSRSFAEARSPFALALVRVAVFAGLLLFTPHPGPVFEAACLLGAFGLFVRTAGWVAVALGLASGNASPPLLWAAALLAVAPCADTLAGDAIPDAWRRADARTTAPPDPSRLYGAPLRVLEFAIGLFYISSGEFTTVAFGVAFVLILLTPGARLLALVAGLVVEAYAWREGGPRGVLVLYLAFFDWAKVFHGVGQRLFPHPLAIVNDGDCGFCRRAIASLRTLDVLQRIDWTASTDRERVRALGLDEIADTGEIEHFTAVFPGGTAWGYDAYLRLAKRIPFFWPALPILALPPLVELGRATYAKVEAARPDINPDPLASRPATTLLGVWIVGAGIVLTVAWLVLKQGS